MEHVLQNLIAALRGSGVRISVSESIDAMNALMVMGYDNRQILKDSLSATLAKSRHEKALFDSCFDCFFPLTTLQILKQIALQRQIWNPPRTTPHSPGCFSPEIIRACPCP